MARFRCPVFLTSTLAFALTAISAFATSTMTLGSNCWRYMRDWVVSVPAKFKEVKLEHPEPAKQLVQACAHAARLAKRERPLSFGTWRMCPSA